MEEYISSLIRVVSLVICFSAFFFGIPGNSFVIHIIRKHPRFRTVHNLFHASLATVDLINCIVGSTSFFIAWCLDSTDVKLVAFMCTVNLSFSAASNMINITNLIMINIIRVYVVHKRKYVLSKAVGIVIVTITWVLGTCAFFIYILKGAGPAEQACLRKADAVDTVGTLPILILFFYIPAISFITMLCLGSYLYLLREAKRMRNLIHPITTISHRIHREGGLLASWRGDLAGARGVSGSDSSSVSGEPFSANFIVEMGTTSSILTMVYVISTLPTTILSVAQIWFTVQAPIVELCFISLYFSMFVNPYIYAYRNKTFRNEFNLLIFKVLR